jgi:hypothetical protein
MARRSGSGRAIRLLGLAAVAILSLLVVADCKATMQQAQGTSQLFDEPYRPNDSRHFDVGAATSTFSADAAKQFDLAYYRRLRRWHQAQGLQRRDLTRTRTWFTAFDGVQCQDIEVYY